MLVIVFSSKYLKLASPPGGWCVQVMQPFIPLTEPQLCAAIYELVLYTFLKEDCEVSSSAVAHCSRLPVPSVCGAALCTSLIQTCFDQNSIVV